MREPAVIFDFGNVVGFFDYLKVCERLGPRLGLTGEAFRSRIAERGFAELLGRFESGKIAPEQFATGGDDTLGPEPAVPGIRRRLARHLLAQRIGRPN